MVLRLFYYAGAANPSIFVPYFRQKGYTLVDERKGKIYHHHVYMSIRYIY